jgi:GTP cyclohydrolase I
MDAMNLNANTFTGNEIQPEDIQRMEQHFAAILEGLQINWTSDQNTKDTPKRFIKMLLEATKGKRDKCPKLTSFVTKSEQMIIVGPITVKSICSHHFLPVLGHCWIGILPDKKLLGLSKFSRLVDWVFRRPQIQENATEELADELEKVLNPKGIAIVVDAAHMCQQWRGVEDETARMKTNVMRGIFMNSYNARQEFLAVIK